MSRATRVLDGLMAVLKVLIVLAFIVVTAYNAWHLIAYGVNDMNDPTAGEKLTVAIVVIIFGSIAYGIITIVDFIGLIISLANKYSEKRKSNIIFFVVFLLVPIITELLSILILKLIV